MATTIHAQAAPVRSTLSDFFKSIPLQVMLLGFLLVLIGKVRIGSPQISWVAYAAIVELVFLFVLFWFSSFLKLWASVERLHNPQVTCLSEVFWASCRRWLIDKGLWLVWHKASLAVVVAFIGFAAMLQISIVYVLAHQAATILWQR